MPSEPVLGPDSRQSLDLSSHYQSCSSAFQPHNVYLNGRGDLFEPQGGVQLPSPPYASASNTQFYDTNYNQVSPRKDSWDSNESITIPRATLEKLCHTCRTTVVREASVTPQHTTPRFLPQRVLSAEQITSCFPLTPDPCMKPGKTMWSLDEPMRPRPPQKPFQCHHCEKEFPKKADRDRHEASVHRSQMVAPPGLWPCQVPGCTRSKGFTRKDNLLDHLRRVHNEHIPKRNTKRNGRMMGIGVSDRHYYGGR